MCSKKTAEVISILCSLNLNETPQDVKAIEEQILQRIQAAGREFYCKVLPRCSSAGAR